MAANATAPRAMLASTSKSTTTRPSAVAKRNNKGSKRRNERNILTFYEKIAVIRYYDETNISRNSLAKMFHCCATQIRRILERKDELLQQLATLSEADASIIIEEMTRKRRKFEMSAISFILHQWVERCRQLRLRKGITNQTLKETALKMAAILNLPSFRPSYRWLNRFRDKYKYNEENLGAEGEFTVIGELAVEDIIIEFKDSLPSFMQKEISVITSAAKVDEKMEASSQGKRADVSVFLNDSSFEECEVSESEAFNDVVANSSNKSGKSEESEKSGKSHKSSHSQSWQPQRENNNCSLDSLPSSNTENTTETSEADSVTFGLRVSAGITAVLNSIFPHLAIIHQFALFNSDVKALELISQLGVHMQTQAAAGAYKQLSLATNSLNETVGTGGDQPVGGIYADIDDIVLIE